LSQNYVGTEHILLGLVQEGSGVAARILENNGITEEKILNLIDQLIVSNYNVALEGKQNYSPLAIGVLQSAYREATRYKSALIGTEHILIAIIKDSACIAHKLLLTMNINIQKIYMEILSAMGEDTERRDNYEKIEVKTTDNIVEKVEELLSDIQKSLYEKALKNREDHTYTATTLDEMEKIISTRPGFIKAMWCGNKECEEKIKEVKGIKSRLIPFEEEHVADKCVACGKEAKHQVVWGIQY